MILKVFDICCGELEQVRKLFKACLPVNAIDVRQVKDLLNLKKFHEYGNVTMIPEVMNFCRCVVTCREFVCIDEREIVHEMKDQGVIAALAITRFEHGNRVNTASVALTFGKARLPAKVNVGSKLKNLDMDYIFAVLLFQCVWKKCRRSK